MQCYANLGKGGHFSSFSIYLTKYNIKFPYVKCSLVNNKQYCHKAEQIRLSQLMSLGRLAGLKIGIQIFRSSKPCTSSSRWL